MQFTASLIALFAATALAAPGTPVQERQATPTALAQFWNSPNGNTCDGPLADDTVFAENDPRPCIPITITNPFKTFSISGNTLTRTLRLFNQPGCNPTTSNFIDVPAGQNVSCSTLAVKSARICPVGGCPDN